jgi:ADP-heptose:LPS heptosyltransferase
MRPSPAERARDRVRVKVAQTFASTDRPRILVLCRKFLGDTVLVRPVFENLRAWQPNALIAAASYGELHSLALHPEIDRVLLVPRTRPRRGKLARWRTLLRHLREAPWDLVYDMAQTDRSSVVTLLSGGRVRVGFAQRKRQQRHRVYQHVSVWTEDDFSRLHARDLYLKPLEEVGVPVSSRSVSVQLTREESAWARRRIGQLLPFGGGPLVIAHPGAGAPNKLWPPQAFAAVVDAVQESGLGRVLLISGATDEEPFREMKAALRTEAPVVSQALSVRELAALLAEGDLLFCHDSGPMHLAAAVGTRVVALFGASSPVQWGPLGEGHTVLRASTPCSCPFGDACTPPHPYHTLCVRRLTVDEVRCAVLGSMRQLFSTPLDASGRQ